MTSSGIRLPYGVSDFGMIIDDDYYLVDKTDYNGYLFCEDSAQRINNPDMVLYFLKAWQNNDKPPKRIIDSNIASDYGKIRKLFVLQEPFRNSQALDELMMSGETTASLTTQFSFERDFDRNDFVSLLFYLGYVSIKKEKLSKLTFEIPNYVIKELYSEFYTWQGKQKTT